MLGGGRAFAPLAAVTTTARGDAASTGTGCDGAAATGLAIAAAENKRRGGEVGGLGLTPPLVATVATAPLPPD